MLNQLSLISYLMEAGSFDTAIQLATHLLPLTKTRGLPYLESIVLVNLAAARLERDDLKGAVLACAEGTKLALENSLTRVALYGFVTWARANLAEGDLKSAQQRLADSHPLVSEGDDLWSLVNATQAVVAQLTGDQDLARRSAEQAFSALGARSADELFVLVTVASVAKDAGNIDLLNYALARASQRKSEDDSDVHGSVNPETGTRAVLASLLG